MFSGKKILVSAGPTYEPLDPVRFIGNRSTGKMGVFIAEAFADEGAEVVLVLGPGTASTSRENIKVIEIETAEQLYIACMEEFLSSDIIVMAAAVADYTPVKTYENKKKKAEGNWFIELKRTKDVLSEMGNRKQDNQVLVGFALESENELENAKEKLKKKKADIIVLNSLKNAGAGFQYDTNQVTILDNYGNINKFDLKPKTEVALDILKSIANYASLSKNK